MFASLRFDAFIGGNDENDEIDSAHAREHVADKTLVTGDIDETHANCAAIGGGKVEMRETDVDGDAAAFFFFEAVGIHASQGFDERCLAMIDVSGGADDDGFHQRQYRWRSEHFLSQSFTNSTCVKRVGMRQ